MVATKQMAPARFVAAVNEFVAEARAEARDGGGLTWEEFAGLTEKFLALVVAAAEVTGSPGVQKKAWVMEAAGYLFDVLTPLVVPVWLLPAWWAVKRPARELYLAVVSRVVEMLVGRLPDTPEVQT
jgi:hypothetical protein